MNSPKVLVEGGWNPKVYEWLLRLVAEKVSRKRVAVFDFDGTMIKGDIGEAVFIATALSGVLRVDLPEFRKLLPQSVSVPWKKWRIGRSRLATLSQFAAGEEEIRHPVLGPLWSEYQRLMHELGSEAAYRWTAQTLVGLRPERVERISRAVWDRELFSPLGTCQLIYGDSSFDLRVGIKVYREVKNLIEFLHHLGWEVWVVSASNQYTIHTLSHHFGIPPERAIGIGLQKNGWRRLSSSLSSPVSAGSGKVDVLKQYGLSPDLVIGDSMGDHAMLSYATYRGARIVVIGERIPPHHRHSNWLIQPEETLNAVEC